MRLPGVEPGSIAWKAIILTVGLQTHASLSFKLYSLIWIQVRLIIKPSASVICQSCLLQYGSEEPRMSSAFPRLITIIPLSMKNSASIGGCDEAAEEPHIVEETSI